MNEVELKPTTPEHLNYVIQAERDGENSPYVGQWAKEKHLASLSNDDIGHFIVVSEDGLKVGYIILAGLMGEDESIEFMRLVVTEKARGFGKQVLRRVKKYAFEELKANRLWLDVREKNARAHGLYLKEGFTEEGKLRECVKVNGEFESLIVLSMLRREYLGDR